MRAKLLIVMLAALLVCPTLSYGFGLLRYTFDAIANQLGLDRGPIPKVVPKFPQADFQPGARPPGTHPDYKRIYIQAEGF